MSLKKNFAHDYDPSIVFQSHSSDLPHLNDWISELIALSDKSLPIQSSPTTEQLVQALQRYDAMFRELLRQTSVFSEPVTRLLAKVWGGNLKLMDYMIKSYHRYVKHTTHLQEQAQHLLTERQGQMVAAKVKDEEFEMEKLVLRAKIRNLESELEALKLSDRSKDKEIMRLRTTVTAYMKSEDLSESLWKIMHANDPITLTKDGEIPDQIESKFCRKDAIDASIFQLKQLSRLDVEMDEVISAVMKEEDRQRMIVADILRLMKKNEAVFGVLRKVKGAWQSGVIEPTKFEDKGVQADERDLFGAVSDLVRSPRSIPRINPPAAPNDITIVGADVPYQLRKLMKTFPRILRIPPAAWVCQTIMAIYFDKVRIDEGLKEKGLTTMPLAVHMYDYFQRSMGNAAAADTQVAQMLVACEYYKERFPRVALFGSQIGIFNKNEDPSLDVRDTDFLLSIIRLLLKNGEMQVVDHSSRANSSQQAHRHHHGHHHHQGHDAKKNVASNNSNPSATAIANVNATSAAQQQYLQRRHSREMIQAVESGNIQFRTSNSSTSTTAATSINTCVIWDNIYTTVGSDISRNTAAKVVLQVLGRWLPDSGADYVMKVKAMNSTDKAGKMIDIDEFMDSMLEPWSMIRINWVEHARYLFKEHCLIHKVLSEAQFSDDQGQVERDSILVEVQRVVAVESQRRPMRAFQVRSAIQEGRTGAGGGGGSNSAANARKSMGANSHSSAGNTLSTTKDKGIQLEKEPVCETMNRKLFASVIRIMDSSIPQDKIDAMFDDACAWSHESCLHVLSYMWLRCAYEKKPSLNDSNSNRSNSKFIQDVSDEEYDDDHDDDEHDDGSVDDNGKTKSKFNSVVNQRRLRKRQLHGRYYYVNTKSKRTQWTRPYHERTFYASEIEVDAFIAIVLKHDILANCPFVELFHVSPPDLWPNAVLFLKQAQDAKLKAKRIADSLMQQQAQQQAQQQLQLQQQAAASGPQSATKRASSGKQQRPSSVKLGRNSAGSAGNASDASGAGSSEPPKADISSASNKTSADSKVGGSDSGQDQDGETMAAGSKVSSRQNSGSRQSSARSDNNSRPNSAAGNNNNGSSSRPSSARKGAASGKSSRDSSINSNSNKSPKAKKKEVTSLNSPGMLTSQSEDSGNEEPDSEADGEGGFDSTKELLELNLSAVVRPGSASASASNSGRSRPLSGRSSAGNVGGNNNNRLTLVAEVEDENISIG